MEIPKHIKIIYIANVFLAIVGFVFDNAIVIATSAIIFIVLSSTITILEKIDEIK